MNQFAVIFKSIAMMLSMMTESIESIVFINTVNIGDNHGFCSVSSTLKEA